MTLGLEASRSKVRCNLLRAWRICRVGTVTPPPLAGSHSWFGAKTIKYFPEGKLLGEREYEPHQVIHPVFYVECSH